MKLVLDAEALVALLDRGHGAHREVRSALERATRLGHDVWMPTVTLAELYRGQARSQAVDALLSRWDPVIRLRDTDRRLSRLVGGVLHAAGSGSEDLVDASAIAVGLEDDRAVVLTGDPRDLERLGAPYPTVTVVALP